MTTKVSSAQIDFLIYDLGEHEGLVAQRARKKLEQIGAPAVPALVDTLQVGSEHARWEAAKALENMPVPEAIDALVIALEDTNQDIRWLAAEALIKLRTASYVPLLTALIRHPERNLLRTSAHHVLSKILMMPAVKSELQGLYEALDNKTPASKLRFIAMDALEAVERYFG